jgi:hypothetical protein
VSCQDRLRRNVRNTQTRVLQVSAPGFDGSVVAMYPGFGERQAETCCAWGGVDIIYPFPLVNITSPTAVSSMEFWSTPNRTDEYGLHLKLGYSQKVCATTDLCISIS